MQHIPDPAAVEPPVEITTTRSGGVVMPAVAVLVLAVLGLGAWKVAGGGDRAWHHDLRAGMTAAEQARRPALVLFTADWCPPCQMLKKEILPPPQVAEYLASEYVCIKIDLTDRDGPNAALARKWTIGAIPTMVVLDPAGTEIDSRVGPLPPAELRAWLARCRGQVR